MDVRDLYPAVFARLQKARRPEGNRAGAFRALCPAHEDRSPSLSLWPGRDGRLMFGCHAGCPKAAILAALGLSWGDCFPPREGARRRAVRVERTHEYLSASGEVLYRKCIVREAGGRKRGFWQRWERRDGAWVNGLAGLACVPYRLPELLASAPRLVTVVEGEKDADLLASLGFVATTGGGAGCWLPSWAAEYLSDRPVAVCPDHDDAGLMHAREVCGSLLLAGCPSVRLHRWPDAAPAGWDVADELAACRAAGEGDDELRERVKGMVRGMIHWRAA